MASSVAARSLTPGFRATMAFTLVYLGLVVIIPLMTVPASAVSLGSAQLWKTMTDPRVIAACRLTLTTSFTAALVNAAFGMLVAWVLVRYEFPGRRLIDALIDLPFALPTAVAGITLTTLY